MPEFFLDRHYIHPQIKNQPLDLGKACPEFRLTKYDQHTYNRLHVHSRLI